MIQSKDDLANISNSDYEFECLQQFLIYIASKDYQKALPLSETLRKLNPSNQMFQEYESVLKQRLSQIQQDINELDEADDDDSGISEPELEDESSDEDESDS